jgi:hypothetical protein
MSAELGEAGKEAVAAVAEWRVMRTPERSQEQDRIHHQDFTDIIII